MNASIHTGFATLEAVAEITSSIAFKLDENLEPAMRGLDKSRLLLDEALQEMQLFGCMSKEQLAESREGLLAHARNFLALAGKEVNPISEDLRRLETAIYDAEKEPPLTAAESPVF